MKGATGRTGLILAALVFYLALAPMQAGSETSGGCVTGACHTGMLQHKFVHGPTAVEQCELCHMPTGKHAFRLAGAGQELCYICHERGKAKNVNCIKCHDPHGTDLEFQLKAGAGTHCKK